MDRKNRTDRWLEPVVVHDGRLTPVIIQSTGEALEYLENRWNAEKERHHQIAREICLAADKRQVSADAARENFIRAVTEARFKICAPETAVSDPAQL